ncbi:hypothetical protein EVAR_79461_1 [Eumeta japonica]|uniref:Uncharacterized protein n=1 Tax=Eumeta variegata TaxID=151549 RepID=A0A4C1UDJ9_EUMVA|nr:hypothetical protein EVAR_79461_1 [Eumeta japonica]
MTSVFSVFLRFAMRGAGAAREKCRNPAFYIFIKQSRTSPGDAAQIRPRDFCSKTLQGARTKEHDAQASNTSSRPLQRKHRRVQNASRYSDEPNKGAFSDDRRMTEYVEHPCPPVNPTYTSDTHPPDKGIGSLYKDGTHPAIELLVFNSRPRWYCLGPPRLYGASMVIPERPHTVVRLLKMCLVLSVLFKTAKTIPNAEPSLRCSLCAE